MTFCKRISIPVFLGLVYMLAMNAPFYPQTPADEDVVSGDLAVRIDTYLRRITPFGFAGTVLVAKDGRVILNKGYGLAVRSGNIPNSSQSVIVIGSITKQFTAAGILKLEMQGRVRTDDLMAKYFENVPLDKKAITLHHLLTHTSGLIGYTGGDSMDADFERAERDATIEKGFQAPLLFPPGTDYRYSNTGYSVLAAIIEKVSGQSYEQFLRDNLFQPAGMSSTGYRLPDWSKHIVSRYYSGEKDLGTFLERPYPYWNLLGNGGLLTTTGDMFRWHLALEGEKILSATAKKKLYMPFLNNYAYGWDVTTTDHGLLIQHNGGGSFGSSDTADFLRFMDAQVVIVVLCHQDFAGEALAMSISPQIAKIVFGGEVESPPAVSSGTDADPSKYTGAYVLPSGAKIGVHQTDGRLALTPHGQEAVDLLAYPGSGAPPGQGLNERAFHIVTALLAGDFKPTEEALADRNESRIKRMRALLEAGLSELKEEIGPFTGVEIGGTVPRIPDAYGDEAADTTLAIIKGQNGNEGLMLTWREGRLTGFRPSRSIDGLEIPCLPLASDTFAAYHLFMARPVDLGFMSDEQGKVTGLRIGLSGQQKVLKKAGR
jgi:CubicO group peptidase (beta-lactamase class C family)